MQFRITLAALALIGLFASSQAYAQGTNPAPAQAQPQKKNTSIAVIDIGYLIKNHPRMAAEMESIKAEMAKAQEEIEERRQKLVKDSESIGNTYNPDSPQFKQQQESLINQESKLRVDFMGKEKEFAEKQAAVIFNAYQQITGVVQRVVAYYQYDIVIRYSREQYEMDPKKPATVNFGVQRDVIFHNGDIDITDLVLNTMKQEIPAAAAPATTTKTNGPIAGQNEKSGTRQATPGGPGVPNGNTNPRR